VTYHLATALFFTGCRFHEWARLTMDRPVREPTSGTLILNAERQRPTIGLVRCRWPAQRSVPLMSDIELFYSYSHKDEALKDQLVSHPSNLRRQGVIREWHDRKIGSGTEWAKEIDEHLNSAEVILLLISSDFIASEYCHEIEMKRAMERHESGEARVIPVILRSVDWSGLIFRKLQAAPKDGVPVTKWADRDEAFMNVAQAIRAAVAELTRRKKESGAKSKARDLYAEYINCGGNERDRQIALGERILALEPNHKVRSALANKYLQRALGRKRSRFDDLTKGGLIAGWEPDFTDEDYRKAVADLNAAIELSPDDAELYYWRGKIHGSVKSENLVGKWVFNYRQAFADLTRAIDLEPDRGDFYYARALLQDPHLSLPEIMRLSSYHNTEKSVWRSIMKDPERMDDENFIGVPDEARRLAAKKDFGKAEKLGHGGPLWK
jgi:tetratricopeptide (TPR) repeat protein